MASKRITNFLLAIFLLQRQLVLIRLVNNTDPQIGCQGDFYESSTEAAGRPDFYWAGDAARFRDARHTQHGATGAAEPAANVFATEPHQRPTAGSLRAGHVLRGGGAGAESTAAGGAMPVVVLEQEEKS